MLIRHTITQAGDSVIAVFDEDGTPRNVTVTDPRLAAAHAMHRAKTQEITATAFAAITEAQEAFDADAHDAESRYQGQAQKLVVARDTLIARANDACKAGLDALTAEKTKLDDATFAAAERQLIAQK